MELDQYSDRIRSKLGKNPDRISSKLDGIRSISSRTRSNQVEIRWNEIKLD
jgi:hypothetical protein